MAGPTQAAGSFKRILNPFNNSGQQPESSSHIRQNKPDTKCGWLFKQGGVIKSWHRRWFVVKGDQLHYFSTRDESKQMGIIYLPGNRVVEMPLNPAEPDRFPFEIQPGKNDPWKDEEPKLGEGLVPGFVFECVFQTHSM